MRARPRETRLDFHPVNYEIDNDCVSSDPITIGSEREVCARSGISDRGKRLESVERRLNEISVELLIAVMVHAVGEIEFVAVLARVLRPWNHAVNFVRI